MRHPIAALTGAVILAACGSAGTEAPAAQPAATSVATATTALAAAASAPTTQTIGEPAPEPSWPSETVAPATDATPADDSPTTTPAAQGPTDGCSPDNVATDTDVADGPLPNIAVSAASVGRPLPAVAVRRINCDGGWVNLANELPADRPLLVWFWAPH